MSEAARAAGLDRTQHLESRELAIEMLGAALRAGDTVLVKGSRALGLEVVVQALERGSERGRDS
jgi:UDP-N-acetylmuramyl pentapeptide synthase